ncbi:hypothetical protein YC2023_024175 [Brassica napus]
MPATVNVHRLTTVSSFDCFSDSTAFEDISEPVFPIPEEHFRFPDHSELPGLANSNTQIPDIIDELTAVKGTVSDHLPQGKYCVMATIKIATRTASEVIQELL